MYVYIYIYLNIPIYKVAAIENTLLTRFDKVLPSFSLLKLLKTCEVDRFNVVSELCTFYVSEAERKLSAKENV